MEKRKIDIEKYYRKGVYRHFTKDCKCSVSMTARVDVTDLYKTSKKTGTRFYLNFLYLITKTLNSRDDYKMYYDWQTDELYCFDQINPTQYAFHMDTETCTPVYSTYYEDYETFYREAEKDLEEGKKSETYNLDMQNHINWFDASCVPFVSYDSLNVELPDGHLYFQPIINFGKYREENGRLMMPLTVRLNHAVADGYLVSKVFTTLEEEMKVFVKKYE